MPKKPSRPAPHPVNKNSRGRPFTPSTSQASLTGINEFGEGTVQVAKHLVKIPRSLPGDKVSYRIVESKGNYARGQLLSIISASPERVKPECPHFEQSCGGCQWLHMNYAFQLKTKQNIVVELLQRRFLRCEIGEIIGMAQPRAYRNKMSLANKDGRLAYLKEFSDQPLYPRQCMQESLENQNLWLKLRDVAFPPEILQVHLRSAGGRVGVVFFVKHYTQAVQELANKLMQADPAVIGVAGESYRDYRVLCGKNELEQELGGISYRLPLNGFIQTNYSQALQLRKLVTDQVSGTLDAAGKPSQAILDLYCGSGFFSLALAKLSAKVLAIESNKASVASAVENARINKIDNCHFMAMEVEKGLGMCKAGEFSLIVLDPPREGCSAHVLKQVARLAAQRIVYVSCSPQSLSKDLLELCNEGYRLIRCQSVDMFPHTFHVETVAMLERNKVSGRKDVHAVINV